jgi:sugar transferase (PEP-CTERM/EpsH1 system associated)
MSFIKPLGEKQPPLILHIVYRLAVGGLENGLVNLINQMPPERYRHAIVCLTKHTDFYKRIQREDVSIIDLHKHNGQDFGIYSRLWKIFRDLRPAIVHTRNLTGLEYLFPAALAGVPGRIHGEHGLDIHELNGSNIKYNFLRKVIKPAVQHFIAVSEDLSNWMIQNLGVKSDKVTQIYNGVDLKLFHPRTDSRPALGPMGLTEPGSFVIGTVGRMQAVKDQLTLVKAFLILLAAEPSAQKRLRLVIIGDGTLRGEALTLLRANNADHLAWLPGEKDDIPEIMRGLDLFVLPSLREGISNTILEAMASGLPVIATDVGGNPELVVEGETGTLVPPADPMALAETIRRYLNDNNLLVLHGKAGRQRAEARFSMEAMVNGYLTVYDGVLKKKKTWVNSKPL